MSTREIIEELPRLTVAELKAVEQRISELASRRTAETTRSAAAAPLRAARIEGCLVLTGPRVIRQVEVEAILNDFP